MNAKRFFIIIILVFSTVVACGAVDYASENDMVTATGTIQKSGITTYMYGTHVLKDDNDKTLYALTSDTINLDDYVNIKNITVKGSLIRGYPVDGGPDYLMVIEVEVK
jgi:hypothetical protein